MRMDMLLRAFIAIVMLGSTVCTAQGQLCGDADGNGAVTLSDGVQVLRRAAGLSSPCGESTCDMDGNGDVTLSDGVNVLRDAAGLPVTRDCPAGDSFIENVERSDGLFGVLTKIPLRSPINAPETLAIEPPTEVLPGSRISFSVTYVGVATAAGTGDSPQLFVASRPDGSPPTGSSFQVPLEGDEGRATIHVGLRGGAESHGSISPPGRTGPSPARWSR